jgi:DHA2 family multidrug resistance protein
MALGNLKEKTAQGVSFMHYLRFVDGSLGTAIATNTLEKSQALHLQGIGILQTYDHVHRFVEQTAMRMAASFPGKAALVQAQLFFGKVQHIQALSFAFQDTFRHCFIFALLGSVFLLMILLIAKPQPHR